MAESRASTYLFWNISLNIDDHSVVWQIPEFFTLHKHKLTKHSSFFFPFTKFYMLEWFRISSCSVKVRCSSLFVLSISLTRQYSINYTENVIFSCLWSHLNFKFLFLFLFYFWSEFDSKSIRLEVNKFCAQPFSKIYLVPFTRCR